jgi:nitric oxide reductase subunit B
MDREPMPIARGWFQGAILTYLVGFTVLGVLAYLVYRDQPPLPTKVVASDKILFTRDDVIEVWQRFAGKWATSRTYGTVFFR